MTIKENVISEVESVLQKRKEYYTYEDFPYTIYSENGGYKTYEGGIIVAHLEQLGFEKRRYNKVYDDKLRNGNLVIFVHGRAIKLRAIKRKIEAKTQE